MRRVFPGLFLALAWAPGLADPTLVERETQRALMARDRQAAEFSRPELRAMPEPSDAAPLRPDERVLRQRNREAFLLRFPPPPAPPPSADPPLPLPGGPGRGVDPVAVPGARS